MAEKEIAFISFGIIIFIFIIFFSLLLYTLGDKLVYDLRDKDSGLVELNENDILNQKSMRR